MRRPPRTRIPLAWPSVVASVVLLGGGVARPVDAQGFPPAVVAAEPRTGEIEVPAHGREIVISFDLAMAPGGFSFIGGGPTFPEVTSKPAGRGAPECVLPVLLAPGHS